MMGSVKSIETKADFDAALLTHPEEVKSVLTVCLVDRMQWFSVGVVDSVGDGIVDDSHKIVEEKGFGDKVSFTQYALLEDPNWKISKMGLTLEEVESLLR